MKEEAVELSDGKRYLVKRPTLAGWKAIFESIPQDDLNKVFDLWQEKAKGEEKDPLAFSQLLFGSLPKFPDMAAAILSACLATTDNGTRCISVNDAMNLFDDDDVLKALVALSESGFFADIVARAKNLLGRGRQAPGESE